MSNAVLARLPRFDADTGDAAERLRRVLETAGDAEAERQATPAEAEAPAPEPDEPDSEPPAPPGPDPAALDAAIVALGEAAERVEREGQAQVAASLAALAGELFPRLAEAFLAAEIARHMEGLVPVSVAAIEITAPAELAERLGDAIARSPALSERCTVASAADSGDTRVEVSWSTGGAIFDFDALLAACLARLEPA